MLTPESERFGVLAELVFISYKTTILRMMVVVLLPRCSLVKALRESRLGFRSSVAAAIAKVSLLRWGCWDLVASAELDNCGNLEGRRQRLGRCLR